MSAVETPTDTVTIDAAVPAPLRMSYEEWLQWDHQGSVTEWVDGEVIVDMPPLDEDQRIVGLLATLLNLFVQIYELGIIRLAPFTMRIRADGPAREPDLFFLAKEHRERLTQHALVGPADLIVEVVSQESIARDRSDKFYEYQEGGVREYWIIDPRAGKQRVDLYVLDAQGRYQPVPPTAEGIYYSSVLPGFWVNEAWLWAEEPNALAALAAIVGPERLLAALQSQTTA
jgi:Uma2 family endonuclease